MKNNKIKFVGVTSASVLSVSLLSVFASSVFAGYGSSPASAPVCNNSVPAKAAFSFVRKSGASEIEVGWNEVSGATSWTLAYGNQPGKYIYGMSNFGDNNSRSVNINMLPAGTYYAAVKANNGCMPGPFSDERKITVGANGSVFGIRTSRGSVLSRVTETPAVVTPTPTETEERVITIPSVNEEVVVPEVRELTFWQRLVRFILGR